MCSGVLIFRRSNNFTVLSVEPVATTHSLKGLKAKQLTWQDIQERKKKLLSVCDIEYKSISIFKTLKTHQNMVNIPELKRYKQLKHNGEHYKSIQTGLKI